MFKKTIKKLSKLISLKKISAKELVIIFLNRIKKSNLNCFLTINEDLTLKQAEKADKKINKKKYNKLTGIPIAHKDIFVTKKWKTTAGSKMLKNFKSPFNATIITLLNKVGAINLGKLNCDEFAMGNSNENSYFGNVKNPWYKKMVPGGSSGGSAAAVAAGLTPAATGTDTGGSIRQPSSWCGVTGIKPTYGSISRFGMISFASSLDQGGIIAKTSEDCAILLNTIISYDNKDSTSLKRKKEDYTKILKNNINGIKIGLPKEFFKEKISKATEIAIQNALIEYQKMGAKLIDISLPNLKVSIPVYYIISSAEASSNLSKFDGIKYGISKKIYKNISELYRYNRTNGFGEEVKKRILLGTYILSENNYKKYYLKAQKIRRLITLDFQKNLVGINKKCDVIMSPVTSETAWKFKKNKKLSNYISDIFTTPANLAGLPSISIPCGFEKKKNIKKPIGLQIIGNYLSEAYILNISHQYQLITNWHKKTPNKI